MQRTVWISAHELPTVMNMARFTNLCYDCGFGGWTVRDVSLDCRYIDSGSNRLVFDIDPIVSVASNIVPLKCKDKALVHIGKTCSSRRVGHLSPWDIRQGNEYRTGIAEHSDALCSVLPAPKLEPYADFGLFGVSLEPENTKCHLSLSGFAASLQDAWDYFEYYVKVRKRKTFVDFLSEYPNLRVFFNGKENYGDWDLVKVFPDSVGKPSVYQSSVFEILHVNQPVLSGKKIDHAPLDKFRS